MSDIGLNEIDNTDKKQKIISFIQNGKNTKAQLLFEELHPVDQSEFISNMDSELRIRLVAAICNTKLQFLIYLDDHIKEDVIDLLGSKYVSRGIKDLDLDDIVKIVEILEQKKIDEIINNFPQYLLENVKKRVMRKKSRRSQIS